MYDRIMVTQKCPYCKTLQTFECQTKDLDQLLYEFHPLDEGWEDPNTVSIVRKDFRVGLPVFKNFPLDKEWTVWADQAEFIETRATLSDDKKKLGYISGFGRYFEGKIKVKDGKLIGQIYDIIFDDEPEYEELKFLEELKKIRD